MYPQNNPVAGVVVLFNPQEDVIENINSYLFQVGLLVIVDNSSKPCTIISELIKHDSNVRYIFNNGNLGVAAALNIGAEIAIKEGYSYLLTMDQDSKATPGMVQLLYEGSKAINNLGIASPFHVNKFQSKIPPDENYTYKSALMTSGNILNLSAYKEIGGFNQGYFIDHVDTEFCLRLNLNNYRVVQFNKIMLTHNEADISRKNLFFRSIFLYNHSPVRFYYKSRNRLYLRKSYKKLFPGLFKIESKLFWFTVLKVIFFEPEKYIKLKMVLMGIVDFFKHKTNSFNSIHK